MAVQFSLNVVLSIAHSALLSFVLKWFSVFLDSLWVSALQETVGRMHVLYNFGFRQSGIFSVRICASYWTPPIPHCYHFLSLFLGHSLSLKLFDPDRHFLPTPKLHALESYWVNYTVHLRPRNICQYRCYLVRHGFIFLLPVALQRRVACNLLHAAKSTSLKWFKCALLAFLCLLCIMSSTKMVST